MGDVRRVHDAHLDRVLAMKVLAWDLVDSEPARQRFVREACMTAGLQHPSIVAVHDRGELDDGRLYFTMPEVRGVTFAQAIDELHASVRDGRWHTTASGWSLQRLLDSFRRVCEAMAYAHSRRVVHRDLKPANLMLGSFGEVVVMDWGLAKELGSPAPTAERDGASLATPEGATAVGQVLGTPAFMPIEQARGEPVDASADVYALGAVLRVILTGRLPFSGPSSVALARLLAGPPRPLDELVSPDRPPLPEGLVAICDRAMQRHSRDRYPDAGALATEMAAWLEGSRRRHDATRAVERAHAIRPRIESLRKRAHELRNSAHEALAALPPSAPAGDKLEAWRLEDAAEELEREASLAEIDWLQGLRGALNIDPDHPEAHALLASHYLERLRSAERRRDAHEASRAEALLRVHDRGQHAEVLAGRGSLTVLSLPEGAEVLAEPYVVQERRLVTGPGRELGHTPVLDAVLAHGSYLLTLRAPGRRATRYPVVIERGGHAVAVPPGATEPEPVRLPFDHELGPDELYIPAGWAWVGGDPHAFESVRGARVWIDDFVVQRDPVTNQQYVAFLNALVESGREDEALDAAPREPMGRGAEGSAPVAIGRERDGRFHLTADAHGEVWHPDWPVALVSWHAAAAYARWLAERTQKPYRLLSELEWEKAARGVDGRICAWGDHIEPSWACLMGTTAEVPSRAPVDAYPLDVSPYGVRGTVGNVREWCLEAWRLEGPRVLDGRLMIDAPSPRDDRLRTIRGGSWQTVADKARAAGRFAAPPDRRFGAVGFRVGYSLKPA